MGLPTSRDGLAPAARGGKSVRGFIDRYFLAVVSWPSLLIMLLVTAVPFVFTIGLAFYPQRNARSSTVAGQCWMPLLPVANNGYFLVNTNHH